MSDFPEQERGPYYDSPGARLLRGLVVVGEGVPRVVCADCGVEAPPDLAEALLAWGRTGLGKET